MPRTALTTRLGGLLILLSCGAAAACAKRSRATCRFPTASLKKIRAATDASPVSESDKRRWLKMVLGKCPAPPDHIKAVVEAAIHSSPEQRSALLSRGLPMATKAQLAAWDRALESLCPGLAKAVQVRYSLFDPRPPALWKRCGLKRFGLLSAREFPGNVTMNVSALLTQRWLKKQGVDQAVARRLARLLVTKGFFAGSGKEGEMTFPVGRSTTEPAGRLHVTVAATTILLGEVRVTDVKNGRVDANTKRDGHEGHYIDPLVKALRAARAKRATAGKGPTDFLLLMVHNRLPYRLLAEVLYSANKAGFKRFGLGVISPSGGDGMIPFTLFAGAPGQSGAPGLKLGPTTYALAYGSTATKVAPAGEGQKAAARQAIAKTLWAYKAKVNRRGNFRSRGSIDIQVDDSLQLRDLVRVLDALRSRPGQPGKCSFVREPGKARWQLPPPLRPHCLFPYPRLQLPQSEPAPAPGRPPGSRPATAGP